MGLILSIETSTPVCSVALHQDGSLIAYSEIGLAQSHSGSLVPLIEQVLTNANKKNRDLEAIGVSKGPGSYTGLRIGVSTAKGLAYTLKVPLLAVNTLDAMALKVFYGLPTKNMLMCPMLDARRMEVYYKLLDNDFVTIEGTNFKVLEEGAFSNYLASNEVVFFGSGVDKFKPLMANYTNASYVDGIYPSAKYVGFLAEEKLKRGETEDVAYFEPFYLKAFYTPAKSK